MQSLRLSLLDLRSEEGLFSATRSDIFLLRKERTNATAFSISQGTIS